MNTASIENKVENPSFFSSFFCCLNSDTEENDQAKKEQKETSDSHTPYNFWSFFSFNGGGVNSTDFGGHHVNHCHDSGNAGFFDGFFDGSGGGFSGDFGGGFSGDCGGGGGGGGF